MAEAGSGPPTSGIGTPSPAASFPSSFKRRKLSSGSFAKTRCRFAALAASLVASPPSRVGYAAPSLRSRAPDAAPAPWQKAVAQVLSKIFFWMSLANVAPLGGFFLPFGSWHTKAKRWPPCAASTFMTTCPFFFPLVGTATVAAAVQSVPGVAVALNCSRTFEIPPSPGADAMLIPPRSPWSQAVTPSVEKQRLAWKSQVLSGLLSESQAGSPSTQRAWRVRAEPPASFTCRRQRAAAEYGAANTPSASRVSANRTELRMTFPLSEFD